MQRSDVMTRAWELFRIKGHYPAVPFASIGRAYFAGCLRLAWEEYRAAAELAATPTEQLSALAASYREHLDGLQYRGWGSNITRMRDELEYALKPVAAELARREADQSSLRISAVTPIFALAA